MMRRPYDVLYVHMCLKSALCNRMALFFPPSVCMQKRNGFLTLFVSNAWTCPPHLLSGLLKVPQFHLFLL